MFEKSVRPENGGHQQRARPPHAPSEPTSIPGPVAKRSRFSLPGNLIYEGFFFFSFLMGMSWCRMHTEMQRELLRELRNANLPPASPSAILLKAPAPARFPRAHDRCGGNRADSRPFPLAAASLWRPCRSRRGLRPLCRQRRGVRPCPHRRHLPRCLAHSDSAAAIRLPVTCTSHI